MAPTFNAGGLVSGLDTNSIVDQFTKIEHLPIDKIRTQQAALKTKISLVGDIAGKLSALESAATALGKNGTVATATSSNTAFSAAASGTSAEGSYSVQVHTLATAAKARSQAFANGTSQVTGGVMHFSVQGVNTDVNIADGMQIADVAKLINGSGARVTANVVSDGTSVYLTIGNRDTGYPIGQAPSSALGISFTATGTQGQALAAAITQPAANASFDVDGLTFTRKSNVVTDALPGTTLTLKQQQGPAEQLVVSRDSGGTKANLQTFVDAYNSVANAIQAQLEPPTGTDCSQTLASDDTLLGAQEKLQSLISTQVFSTGSIRSLADLGLQTQRDGTLKLDDPTFQKALAAAPDGVNSIFSTASTGIAALTKKAVESEVDPLSGLLTQDSADMKARITSLDSDAAELQTHVDAYRQNLLDQFAAMEQIVSGLNASGQYLTQLSAASSSSGK